MSMHWGALSQRCVLLHPRPDFACAESRGKIYSDKVPFWQYKPDGGVIMAIARGERPELSLPENEFSERIRACVESCWKEDPKQRPSMQEVQLTLESILSDRSEKDKNSCLLVKASKTDQQSFNGQRESIGMQPSANVEPIELTTNRKHIDLPPLAQATVRFNHGMMSPISPGLGLPDLLFLPAQI